MPPKKDAFADLFLSASGSKPKASMNQQQLNRTQSPLHSLNAPNNMWSDLDLLGTKNTSLTSIPNPSSSNPLTPRQSSPSPSPYQHTPPAHNPQRAPVQPKTSDMWDDFLSGGQPQASAKSSASQSHSTSSAGINLLDDEFTDAYVEAPQPGHKLQLEPTSQPPSRPPSRPATSSPAQSSRSTPLSKQSTSSKRDRVLAELIDIGFPVDISNGAIDSVGPDVQKCVNFIMGGSEPKTSLGDRNDGGASTGSAKNFETISTELFSKASFFLSKGRETVLKNIEQFLQPKGDASRPAWMKNSERYKEWLVEGEDGSGQREKLDLVRPPRRTRDEDWNTPELPRRPTRLSAQKQQQQQQKHLATSSPRPQSPVKAPLPVNGSTGSSSPASARSNPVSKTATPPAATVSSPPVEEFDLLGFNQNSNQKSSQNLDQILQVDYDNFKALATSTFKNGDYDVALTNYKKCLDILPSEFDERIVIYSNLAVTSTKIGNYKQAKLYCESGLDMIPNSKITDPHWKINDKGIKNWYLKLLLRKAESLEQLELFPEALEAYLILIKLGMNDRKILEGKRRVDSIVNPKKPQQKPAAPKPQVRPASSTTAASENAKKVSEQFDKQKKEDDEKFRLHDEIQGILTQWSSGKEDNLRSLLVGLPDVIPNGLGFNFLTKKITINDIMLPKKVKINYMKVISSIHPDKLGNFKLRDKMICQGVFIILNKAWDSFREKEL